MPALSSAEVCGADNDDAGYAPGGVGLLFKGIERGPGLTASVDDVDALGRPAGHFSGDLAELERSRAVDLGVALFDHGHEVVGSAELPADGG